MDLYLIRHTQPTIVTGVCYGQIDVALAPGYEAEFPRIVGKLAGVEAVWSSPLARCRALAQRICACYCVELAIDPRLAELHFGEWEGTRWDMIDREQSDRWAQDYWNTAPPGGETYRQLYERVSRALSDISRQDARRVAVVSHAGPIRAALACCLRLQPERFQAFRVAYGGIVLLRGSDDHWELEYLNG